MPSRVEKAEGLAKILAGLRSQGKVVVLAVGGFEFLRPEDIRYLIDARTRGDYLIVGVSPKWAKAKKLPGLRIPARDRAEVLAGLKGIDYITLFEDEDASNLIRLLRPSVLAHSHAFTERSAPERKVAEELGIQILICGGGKVSGPPTAGRLFEARKSR